MSDDGLNGVERGLPEPCRSNQGDDMATDHIQPQPGRRPVYPVDADGDEKEPKPTKPPRVAPAGSPDDPASDENTEPANHPNDE